MSGFSLREDLRIWRKVRRLAVPRQMIERATERRLAGDWRGACAAANIHVGIDLGRLTPAVRSAVLDDLFHLVPDLLRWHLPRAVPRTVLTNDAVLLRRYETGALQVRRQHPHSDNQRLVLRFTGIEPNPPSTSLHASPERWDSRCTGDLTAPATDELVRLQDAGQWAEAWTLAGFDLGPFEDPALPSYTKNEALIHLREGRHDLSRLPAAVRETAFPTGHPAAYIALGGGIALAVDTRDLKVEIRRHWSDLDDQVAFVPAARAERPVDHDLVRLGHLPVDELHPLVAAALFPAHPPAAGPPLPRLDPDPVRVRCHSVWHRVTMTDGVLTIPHPPEEVRREVTLHALGGAPLNGCFATSVGWRDPAVKLPKRLRLLRQELMVRAQHGDGAAMAAWLADGLDPHLRDHLGRTLLHMLSWLPDPDPEPLLLTLLAAGVDLEARDNQGYTPLLFAVREGGPVALIKALLALGAQRDAVGAESQDWERLARSFDRLDELWPAFVVVPGG